MAQAEHDSITRRSFLSGAAALVPAAALPTAAAALPTPPPAAASGDPIFAAIGTHRRAYAELDTFLHELAAVERTAWHAPRGSRRAAKKRLAEAYKTERRMGDIEHDAFESFVNTVPHTLRGAVAALRYVRQRFDAGDPCEEDECMALLASIEQAICCAAGIGSSGTL